MADRSRLRANVRLIDLRSALTDGFNIHHTGAPGTGGGTCFGDSGGPVFSQGTSTIVGVTSFVFNQNCAGGGAAVPSRHGGSPRRSSVSSRRKASPNCSGSRPGSPPPGVHHARTARASRRPQFDPVKLIAAARVDSIRAYKASASWRESAIDVTPSRPATATALSMWNTGPVSVSGSHPRSCASTRSSTSSGVSEDSPGSSR